MFCNSRVFLKRRVAHLCENHVQWRLAPLMIGDWYRMRHRRRRPNNSIDKKTWWLRLLCAERNFWFVMLSATTTACHFQFFVNNAWVVQDTSGAGIGQRWRNQPSQQTSGTFRVLRKIPSRLFHSFCCNGWPTSLFANLKFSDTYCGLLNVRFHSFEIYTFAKMRFSFLSQMLLGVARCCDNFAVP